MTDRSFSITNVFETFDQLILARSSYKASLTGVTHRGGHRSKVEWVAAWVTDGRTWVNRTRSVAKLVATSVLLVLKSRRSREILQIFDLLNTFRYRLSMLQFRHGAGPLLNHTMVYLDL